MKKLKTFENFKLNISPEELEDFLLDAKNRLDSDFENVTSEIRKFVVEHPEVKKDEILLKIWWSFLKEWSLTAKNLGL